MLRVLALLIFCTVSLLTQGAPAEAHAGHANQVRSQSQANSIQLVLVPSSDQGGCPLHHGRCCKSMCAMCYLPMPPQHEGFVAIRLESSTLLPSREDLARPILLGRDPPIPRLRDL